MRRIVGPRHGAEGQTGPGLEGPAPGHARVLLAFLHRPPRRRGRGLRAVSPLTPAPLPRSGGEGRTAVFAPPWKLLLDASFGCGVGRTADSWFPLLSS